MKRLIIPNSLDIDQLIQENIEHYNNESGITRDNIAYMLHCIISKYVSHKKDEIFENNPYGYINLYSPFLQKIIPEYRNCLDFLLACNVIESDNHFICGKKSKGYKISRKYIWDGWKPYSLEDPLVIRRIKRAKTKAGRVNVTTEVLFSKRKRIINYLYDPRLSIDLEACKESIDKEYAYEEYENLVNDPMIKLTQPDIKARISLVTNSFKFLATQIAEKAFEIKIDAGGHRLHTPITRLPKFLRKHITFDGQPLVSVDLKNSQPFFSLLLFKPSFYKKGCKNSSLNLLKVNSHLFFDLCKTLGTSIMLLKILKSIVNTKDSSLETYISDVQSGEVYDRFIDLPKDDPSYEKSRKKKKKEIFKTIYGKPSEYNKRSRFYKTYKSAMKLFDVFKSSTVNEQMGTDKDNHAIFATTLQRIESNLLLDVACNRIHEANPEIPLFTIHDCIITIPQYIDFVEAVILDTLTNEVGYKPTLVREVWQ